MTVIRKKLRPLEHTELRMNEDLAAADRATLGHYRGMLRKLGVTGEEREMLVHRVAIIAEIKAIIEINGWSQVEAASHLKVSPPRVSELNAAAAQKFSTDLLIRYLYRLRRVVRIVVDEIPSSSVRKSESGTRSEFHF